MAASSSALALAASLRARSDDALTALLHARPVREAGIHDVFDLAEALLEPTSVQAALAHLDRATLGVLAAAVLGRPSPDGEAAVARLTELALLIADDTGTVVPDAVAEVLRGWPGEGLPSLEQLIHETPPAGLEALGSADRASADRVASERAFTAVTAVGELVGTLEREPARLLQRGGIALPDWRRLLTSTGAGTDAELATLLAIAETAQLVAPAAGTWRVTERAERWRSSSRVDRWATLVAAWLDQVPPELRDLLRARAGARWGEGLLEYLAWLYPAGGAWLPARAREVIAAAETLGIADASVPSTAGAALLVHGADAASAAMADVFPPEVRQVYIQHDLSIIAPGPLASDVDVRLRELADVESVGLASSYRITAASVTRALTTGRTVEQLRMLLDEISLTGIPQPLEYLLSETAGRFGSLRVGPLEGEPGPDAGAHSYVRADDPTLIGQLVIDQSLASLAPRRTGDHRAVSRFDAETLYWALVDARYPAVFEDADGIIRPVHRTPPRPVVTEQAPDPAARLVRRIREAAEHQPAESGAAWNARQLELAIKAKLEVTVVVRMPDGTEVPYVLEPAALAGGRLRARDRRADIERTLPLSHIVAVEPT
ncbi:MAG: helicase-associated domain-containing protein [Protaetiibacter sp.]